MEHAAPLPKRRSKWVWLALPLAPLLPFYFLFMAVVFLIAYVVAEAMRRARSWTLSRRMRRAGRAVSWKKIEEALASRQPGTFVLSFPSMGWNDADLWWVPESVAETAAREGVPPQKEPEPPGDLEAWTKQCGFERWCQSRYFDESRGMGLLVQCTHWRRQKRRMRSRVVALGVRHPSLALVEVDTWVALAAADAEGRGKSGSTG